MFIIELHNLNTGEKMYFGPYRSQDAAATDIKRVEATDEESGLIRTIIELNRTAYTEPPNDAT